MDTHNWLWRRKSLTGSFLNPGIYCKSIDAFTTVELIILIAL